jgi:hypothetical protein
VSSKMRSIEVTLPWPAKETWPNFRYGHHWRRSWKQVQAAKDLAFWLASEKIGRQEVMRDQKSRWPVHIDIYPPNLRRFDEDGAVGACKPFLDGIAAALRVDDSLFTITHKVHDPLRPHGAVVVTVTAPEAVDG